jgi:hypothetical protein
MSLSASFLLVLLLEGFGQPIGMSFQEAKNLGISFTQLDSLYKSAIHTDTSLAVFKTYEQQDELQKAYFQILKDLGKFLNINGLKWEKPTRCFNRIYFKEDGSIDYFFYNFLGNAEDKPSQEVQEFFKKILQEFIQNYKFALKADVKFVQCGPSFYKIK